MNQTYIIFISGFFILTPLLGFALGLTAKMIGHPIEEAVTIGVSIGCFGTIIAAIVQTLLINP